MISIHTSGLISKFRIQKETIRNSPHKKIWEPCKLFTINRLPLHSTSTADKKKWNKIEIFFELLVMKEMMRIVQTDPQWGCGRALINSNSNNFLFPVFIVYISFAATFVFHVFLIGISFVATFAFLNYLICVSFTATFVFPVSRICICISCISYLYFFSSNLCISYRAIWRE